MKHPLHIDVSWRTAINLIGFMQYRGPHGGLYGLIQFIIAC